MNVSSPDYHLIARVLSEVATAEERSRLETWIAADPGHARDYAVLREAWRISGRSARDTAYDAEADWPHVRARLDEAHATTATGVGTGAAPRQMLARRAWVGRNAVRAAAVAGILLASWAGWRLLRGPDRAPAMAEVTTPRGGRTEVVLPDGTRVRLGAESGIRYAAAFDAPTRVVDLRGMAYFEVVHNPARPFLVRVRDGVTTRVVGTRFVVRAYPESPRVEVAVAEGRVLLGSGRTAAPQAAIGIGQVGAIGHDGVPSVATDSAADAHFGWMRGLLVLRDRPLAEALAELGRWYDVPLAVDDPRLAARRISTTAGNIPLDDALARITLALGVHRAQRGDTTLIVP